jgi:hypothetical protein
MLDHFGSALKMHAEAEKRLLFSLLFT